MPLGDGSCSRRTIPQDRQLPKVFSSRPKHRVVLCLRPAALFLRPAGLALAGPRKAEPCRLPRSGKSDVKKPPSYLLAKNLQVAPYMGPNCGKANAKNLSLAAASTQNTWERNWRFYSCVILLRRLLNRNPERRSCACIGSLYIHTPPSFVKGGWPIHIDSRADPE